MSPPLRRRVVAIVLAVAAVGAAACGSTVPKSVREAAERRDGGGAGFDLPGSSSGTDGTGGDGGGFASGASGGSTGTGGSSGSGGSTRSGSSGAAGTRAGSTATGPGITANTINLGLAYAVNAGAANAAIGAAGISQGDAKASMQIVIDDINANGGVAGRKLVPIWHELDATSPETTDQLYQAACDTWTQDNKVFASFAGGNEALLQCLHSRGVVSLEDNLTTADEATFKRFPYYVEMSSMNLDRVAKHQVPALNSQGYFKGWDAALQRTTGAKAKVGVLTFDTPAFAHATDKVLVPALGALGYAPASEDVIKITAPQRTSDTGAIAAAVSSAVLKFRSDNVTHVLIFEASAVLSLLFLNNAQSQRYFPRYGINTQNGFEVLIDTGNVPASQVIGSMGIGWFPMIDMPPSQNTLNGPYSNDARRACIKLLTSKGIEFPDTNAEAVALNICNSLWFFRDVMKRMGTAALNRDNFMATVNGLGSSFMGAGVFATNFSATQHDGVGAMRWYAYEPGCTCMQYKSGNIAV